jgi:catechol 2,3-dioxygenase-like lactoylglutathione lyase family enzyme
MDPTRTPPGRRAPEFVGVHHVRLPVSDVLRSRDWYLDVLGFEPILVLEEEAGVVGVVLEHPCGITMGLHLGARRAAALSGFAAVALCVGDRDHLEVWCSHLALRDLEHSPITEGHIGYSVEVPDPDGILIQLHTRGHPSADEA